MKTWPHEEVARLSEALFQSMGVPPRDAQIVSDVLLQSSLMGHDSHGVIRVPEYLVHLSDGTSIAAATLEVITSGPSTASVDCGNGLGAVGGRRAAEVAIELAHNHGTSCVITRGCGHVGRLGAYVQQIAESGLIGIATCNSPVFGHFVLPFGGREGRLATNPMAYGIPSSGDPIMADFSTSVAPEGKIRYFRNSGKPLPAGWILDAKGNPSTDPRDFYGPPRGGILPLGGNAGHKGFALSLLVEILGSAIAGLHPTDPQVKGNGMCLIAVDPTKFGPLEEFRQLVDTTIRYVKSSPPVSGVEQVMVPGELEFRTRRQRLIQGIPIDDVTLGSLREWTDRQSIAWPWG